MGKPASTKGTFFFGIVRRLSTLPASCFPILPSPQALPDQLTCWPVGGHGRVLQLAALLTGIFGGSTLVPIKFTPEVPFQDGAPLT